jgi:hypothetical protein
MLAKAQGNLNNKLKKASTWADFMKELNKANIVLTPWYLMRFKSKVLGGSLRKVGEGQVRARVQILGGK